MAEDTGTTYFGVSAAYLQSCMKAGIVPQEVADLSRLRGVGSTGAPLTPEGFRWVYDNVHPDLVLGSVSGGTDVCTAFVGSCPAVPVVAGEIQCRYLGAAVEAFDEDGKGGGRRGRRVGGHRAHAVDARVPVGRRRPRPLPVRLLRHLSGRVAPRRLDPVHDRGSCVIYGRSDSTLNRGGVRIGTSELYRVVEDLDQVVDSLVVDTGRLGHDGRCWLFVVLADGAVLDDDLRATIARRLRAELSPRHVPDEIVAVAEVPRTLNGKKLEVPVKRILLGEPWQPSSPPTAWPTPPPWSSSSTLLLLTGPAGTGNDAPDADRRLAAQWLPPGEPRVAVGRWWSAPGPPGSPASTRCSWATTTSPAPTYLQNVPILGRLLAEWGDRTAGALFLLPLWHPVLVAEQVGTLAALARGPFVLQVGLGDGEAQFAGMGTTLAGGRRPGGGLDVVRRLLAGETVTADRPVAIRDARSAPCPPSRSTCGSVPARPRASTGPLAWATAGSQARGCRSTRPGARPTATSSSGRPWERSRGWWRSAATSTSGPTRPTPTGWPTPSWPPATGASRRRPPRGRTRGGGRGDLGLGELGYTDVLVRHLADDQGEVLASFERLAEVRELVNRA